MKNNQVDHWDMAKEKLEIYYSSRAPILTFNTSGSSRNVIGANHDTSKMTIIVGATDIRYNEASAFVRIATL